MQAQLVLLIAPVMPFYRLSFVFTGLVTCAILICGWIASTRSEQLLNCDLERLLEWDDTCFEDYTLKFKIIAVSVCSLGFLSFVQIPCLGLLYYSNGGSKNKLLPPLYLKLLLTVSITWLGFPIWWLLSYEGMSVLQDTKMNAVGFAVLNVISKGAFAHQVLAMVQQARANAACEGDRDAARELGAFRPRSGSECSVASASSSDPSEVRAALSLTAWLVQFLRNFDDGVPTTPSAAPALPGLMGKKDDSELGSQAPSSGETVSTIGAAGTEGGELSHESHAQIYDALEPMYRRFLRDAGVSHNDFGAMSAAEKVNLREKFDKVASAVLRNDSATRGVPAWAARSAVALADATDEQLLKEMQQRMAGPTSHAQAAHTSRTPRCNGICSPTVHRHYGPLGVPDLEPDSADENGESRRSFQI
jgi:hypothetical protein